MGSNYNDLEEAKTKLRQEIDAALKKDGVWKTDTCPGGEVFGWDMLVHYALQWFERHRPENWHIAKLYRHGCYEWTITAY